MGAPKLGNRNKNGTLRKRVIRDAIKAVRRDGLSPRARTLLRGLHDGQWVSTFGKHMPKAMHELLEAGLVRAMGRVKVIESCFVPIGTKGFRCEIIPERPKWLR